LIGLTFRVAWAIRDELIPLFGYVLTSDHPRVIDSNIWPPRPNFPSTCLSPDQPGFGQVIPSGQVRRRSRKSAQNSIMQIPPVLNNWTVMTSNAGHPSQDGFDAEKSSAPPQWNFRHSEHSLPSPFTKNALTLSPISSVEPHTPSLASHPPSAYRKPMPLTKTGLSVDTRSLNMRECSPHSDELKLPPIQSMGQATPKSPYALPPISAMEDLRGSVTQDSAAVLRRLRMEDGDFPRPRAVSEVSALDRWQSLAHVSSP